MSLTEQFKPFTEEDFAAAFQKEVKNGDFRELLTWKTSEGIEIPPFFHGEAKAHLNVSSHANHWEINDEIKIDDFKKANATALSYLNAGASSLTFIGEINSSEELEILLKEIGIQYIEINFKEAGEKITLLLADYCTQNNIQPDSLKGCFHLKKAVVHAFPKMQSVSINGSKFHEAGANIHQQLAFTIAEAKETLEQMIENGFSPENAISQIRFSMAIGPNFFFEMAKLRALRLLWKNITDQYSKGNRLPLFIHAETSRIWLAKEDANNNLIRATFQAISVALGGADSIYVQPYSNVEQAERISRNVQLVIKEEGFIDKVTDVASGTLYLEQLTQDLTLLSWKKFQEVEKQGGYTAAFQKEIIQKEIYPSALELKKAIVKGKITVIGVNKHQAKKADPNSTEGKILSETLEYRADLKPIDLFS